VDFTQIAQRWHDFFLLTGTAAATLIGLMFVSISFAVGSTAERKRGDVDAWVTPSLVYFAEVFIIAGAAIAPLAARTLGMLLLALLALNATFGTWRLRYLFLQHKEESLGGKTWLWQVLLPVSAQAVWGLGAYGLIISDARGFAAIAGAVTLLLLVAVHNAWNLVIYFIEQR
jgi:hypothetical protein